MQVAAAAASMRGTETVGAKSAARRLSRVLVGRRRRAAVLLLALAYAAAMLMLTIGGSEGSGSSGVVAGVLRRGAQSAPPGSVYRSHLVFERLLPEMRAFASRPNPLVTSQYKKFGKQWEPCISKGLIHSELPPSNGFLIVEANGGLNQQRISICDAIAVAKILNATLVTPAFHLNSVWRDSSKFGDIFDEDHFIESLRKYVRVVKDLPEDVFLRFNHNISIIPNMRTKAFSPPSYYLQHVLPKLLELGAVRIAPFSNRLAHSVPMNIQALRCLTNYKALRFSEPIRILADNMVDRMIKRSFLSGGKYVSVHLRFEEDMVAFSCCNYDGGSTENNAMENARERSWRGKFHRPGRVINPEANRRNGRCPLTPLEVGMMLRGMGFDNTTSLYVASGKIYNAEKYMTPLRRLFPFLQTKHALVTPEELAQFKGHSSRLAALDYTICLHSEVFVMTQGSNFPHFLMGHRRYMYGGHAKTIKPDKRKLVQLFDNPNIRWDRFKHHMQDMRRHSEMKGFALRKPQESIYTLPMPDCMCQQAEARSRDTARS
ncbi:O-fucosyltransferase 9 isoform X1 [Zea mays]|uniref:O-fucosyltransferase family protein n=3 Tax=Zea mays TaxID=4577 RepID=A0A804MJQ9_MAIZE|nr:O-fucosyltransferase 9 isoform X1 [Zea mays]|eukprot:XP_008669805.1 O-fucosyltransferase 9 isoform X1 [Zea mays]